MSTPKPIHAKYETPEPRSRADIERGLVSPVVADVTTALVSAALHEPDRAWVERTCLRLVSHPHAHVRAVVATCIGHLARLHRTLDLNLVEPLLARLATDRDPLVRGSTEDARADIAMFLNTGKDHSAAG